MNSVASSLLDEFEAWLRQRPDMQYFRSQSRDARDSIRIEPKDDHGFSVELIQECACAWTIYAGEYGTHIHAADREQAKEWLHLLLSDACRLEISLGAFTVRSVLMERQGLDWKAVEHFGALVPRFWKRRERLSLRNHFISLDEEQQSDRSA
jgi:hypothetical protein